MIPGNMKGNHCFELDSTSYIDQELKLNKHLYVKTITNAAENMDWRLNKKISLDWKDAMREYEDL